MKYILTKDGRIYEIIDETENSFELCGSFEKKIGCNCIMIKRMLGSNEKPAYKQADTIEDLCDEFVLENEIVSTSKCSIMNRRIFEHMRRAIFEASKITHKKCYGAIWTSKGLIYIAVMNDKGVMELL